MRTVCMNPYPQGPDQGDGGVRRVIDALVQYLPEFGWHVTNDPQRADLMANHGTHCEEQPGVPMVSHCHGLYWREYDWPGWGDRANGAVTKAMLRADAVTAPSEWVANAIRRGSLINPTVIYHGVDADQWQPGENLGFVLWNKARVDAVSDPSAVAELARRLPHVPFVTTHGGAGLPNVQQIGTTDYESMKRIVQSAGVYLATVRETFGIGTLEAMASGVPVVGWDFAGQREIIIQGETGILVPYGDYEQLSIALTLVLADRQRMSSNAIGDIRSRWQWRDKVEQYARLYDRVVEQHHRRHEASAVSVVITSYNLNRFLPEAYQSAVHQDTEVIVVDDAGGESAADVLPAGAKAIRAEKNLGLSGARNLGAAHATGTYLIFLDADDMLAPGAIQRLSYALDKDSSIHVACGGLDLVDERGSNRRHNPWPGDVDFRSQCAHLNQLHYSAMWRRDAFIRSGGFRTRDWRAEDASLWLRVMGQGIRVARVTDEATLLYRVRSDSKSQQERAEFADGDGDWTFWLPWRAGARTGAAGSELKREGIRLDPRKVPFSAMHPPAGKAAWPVSHHAEPLISIIIPVGPGHQSYLVDALDSVLAQTFDGWECIVINDTGERLETPGHPWAHHIDIDNYPTKASAASGAGLARNRGLAVARAPLCLFLDADDMLTPDALAKLLEEYSRGGATFVYSDVAHWRERWDGAHEILPAPEFDQDAWLKQSQGKLALPAVTMLIETEAAKTTGFDPALSGWEDGVFYLDLAANGYCGRRVPRPLLMYRTHTGQRRQISQRQAGQLMKTIGARYKPYLEGTMARKSCCGGNAPTISLAVDAVSHLEPSQEALSESQAAPPNGMVRMKYTGPLMGSFPLTGRPSGTRYQFGNNSFDRYKNVDPRDVPYLLSHEGFEVVGR